MFDAVVNFGHHVCVVSEVNGLEKEHSSASERCSVVPQEDLQLSLSPIVCEIALNSAWQSSRAVSEQRGLPTWGVFGQPEINVVLSRPSSCPQSSTAQRRF